MRGVWTIGGVASGLLLCYFGYTLSLKSTDTMSVYTSSALGFSFKYPSHYRIEERVVEKSHRYHYQISLIDAGWKPGYAGEDPPAIIIGVYQNPEQEPVSEWIQTNYYSNFKLAAGAYQATTTADLPAYAYHWSGAYQADEVVFANGDNIMYLYATYRSPDDGIRQDFAKVAASLKV